MMLSHPQAGAVHTRGRYFELLNACVKVSVIHHCRQVVHMIFLRVPYVVTQNLYMFNAHSAKGGNLHNIEGVLQVISKFAVVVSLYVSSISAGFSLYFG